MTQNRETSSTARGTTRGNTLRTASSVARGDARGSARGAARSCWIRGDQLGVVPCTVQCLRVFVVRESCGVVMGEWCGVG